MQDLSALSDKELTLLLKQGDAEAFEVIYNRFWKKLINTAYKRLRDEALCEEIVQDIFINLWEKRTTLTFSVGLKNYLFVAIKYKVIDHYRRQFLNDKFQVSEEHSEYDNSTVDQIFARDLAKYLQKLVDNLPGKCKSVYELSRLEHKSHKEISRLLNISEKTVQGHLTKALQIIRSRMTDALLFFIVFFLRK
ncbi:RNA polymerase sigma-70 factor (ECF subfamily) [Mucilaginibacter gracilis]|uniref:RNA polymerase sigma-70 factor (ECF subfamily) n=1 Tax=Mucilaginibacter gracilis TaxID=423350 RepID=A0A495J1U6_9SPHI|nr:RNA polymerase sigma-70 factor [Mucilaginibacter gracilis]RKR82935.1 RNA polymerase sigma-70 factor (ECF subfamily) [Mucilaginibacter gracilis]